MKRILVRIIPILVIVLSLALAGCARSMTIDGEKVPFDQASLDLRHLNMTADEFGRLRESAPDCDIVWSVPIANTRADSNAGSLSVEALSQQDVLTLGYFTALKEVSVLSTNDYAAIQSAVSAYPDCTFVWQTTVSGEAVSSTAETLDLSNRQVDVDELETAIAVLPALKSLNLYNTGLDQAEVEAFKSAHPDLAITGGVSIGTELFPENLSSLDLSGRSIAVNDLIDALDGFTNLKEVNLTGCTFTDAEKQTLLDAFPDCFFLWEVTFPFGLTVTSDITELDLREYEVEDPDGLIQQVKLLQKLTFLNLSDCGPSNEEMARVRDALPNVKVVWMLHLKYWDIRTDVVAFSMGYRSRKPFPDGNGWYTNVGGKFSYTRLTAKEIEPLKYCTDLVALDIGHAHVHDISALSGLTKMKYLVIALMDIEDISPLANLKELVYVEAFYNMLDDDDLDVFLGMKNLKYLNVGGNDIHDIDVLKQMTQLERLWVNLVYFSDEEAEELIASMPNTEVHAFRYMDPGGNGWPNGNPGYLEMRYMFGFSF